MLFLLFFLSLVGFILYYAFKVILPLKQKLRKDAYKQALKEYDEEKKQ